MQKKLWKLTGNISDMDSKPWLILGDFNELSSPDEKLFFSWGNSTRYNNFNNVINQNNLIDLRYSDNPFTWHNKKNDQDAIFSKLDRAMANYQWICLYPSNVVEFYLW